MKIFLFFIINMFVSISSAKTIVLNNKNLVNIEGSISVKSMKKATHNVLKLRSLTPDCKIPIFIVINTRGGDVVAMENMSKIVEDICNLNTIAISAHSSGALLTQFIKGKRYAYINSTYMFHPFSHKLLGWNTLKELKKKILHIEKETYSLNTILIKRIGISRESFKSKYSKGWTLTGQQAVSEGVADRVVDIKCSKKLINTKIVTITESVLGVFKIKSSKCPL